MSDTDERDARPVRVRIGAVPDLVRAGVTTLLRGYERRVVVVDGGHDPAPDVVVFDPDYTLAARASQPRVSAGVTLLALVTRDDPEVRERARTMGAVQLVSIGVRHEDLVAALVDAREVARRAPAYPELSSREAEVLSLICRGMSNEEIGEHLHLSSNTVKTYIRASYRKIGVQRRSQAVLWGIARGY